MRERDDYSYSTFITVVKDMQKLGYLIVGLVCIKWYQQS